MKPLFIVGILAIATTTSQASITDFRDSTYWNLAISGTGVQSTTFNNGTGIQVDFATGARAGNNGLIYAVYESKFLLSGDFTITSDYELKIWPTPTHAWLAISLGNLKGASCRLDGSSFGDSYAFYGTESWYKTVGTSDVQGKLKLTRNGDTLAGYYWNNTTLDWVFLGSSPGYAGKTFPLYFSTWSEMGVTDRPLEITMSNVGIQADAILQAPYSPPQVVPEPSTCIVGALLLVPLCLTAFKMKRSGTSQ